MSGTFCKVSGIDSNNGAKIVFVWCRAKDQDNYALVGSGFVVSGEGGLPPGIRAGQFNVAFLLPAGCSADTVVVTDDKNGKEFLPGATVTLCSTPTGFQPSVGAIADGPALRASNGSSPS